MPEETLCLSYDIFSLPTAQHRAGLAGLMILLDTMKDRDLQPLPEIQNPEVGIYRFIWTKESLQAVFNEFYDASLEPVLSRTKRSGQTPIKEEMQKNETTGKDEKVYFYEQLTPKVSFFQKTALGMPEPWIHLWRNALWQVLRAQPATRKPYENRSNQTDALDFNKEWSQLEKFQNGLEKGKILTAPLAGSYFIGCQAHNAEKIPFEGRLDENLLLHFWPIVMGVYQPNIITNDGKTEFQGLVLVIPDVFNCEAFNEEYKNALGQLSDEKIGYRPKDAIISIHYEGGLAYAWHLMNIASQKSTQTSHYESKVAGIETYHLKRDGNNVYMLASDRIGISPKILKRYEQICQNYAHPLFRRQLILNLLEENKPWYRGFDNLFSKIPSEFFIGNKTRYTSLFTYNVSKKFESERSLV